MQNAANPNQAQPAPPIACAPRNHVKRNREFSMSKELIVSVNGREKKIAIVEDDLVTEFYVERGDENQGIVGNIYKGRVMKVLPGMQSAFVDIGLERDSFLYVSDFLEDEDYDAVFTDERKEAPRGRPERSPRPPREVAPVEAVSQTEHEHEDDKEADLAAAALRHIEEISEEPVIEPAPDDESTAVVDFEDDAAPPVAVENPRQRRQRRLRYLDREPEETSKSEAGVTADLKPEEPAAEAEPDEETGGRRRRRGRRKRGDDAIAAEPAEPVEIASEVIDESPLTPEYAPIYLVQHEPLERITDDDVASEGAMLKDAMLQEKITERIHAEEYRTSVLDVEPTPEVLVGSLHVTSDIDFERISDDEPAEAARPNIPLAPETLDWDPAAIFADPPSPEKTAQVGPTEEAHSEEEEPLDDATARLSSPRRREEFATRRGGRGRRRQGGFRQRLPVSDATAEGEAAQQAEEKAEAPGTAPAPPAQSVARAPRESREPNGRYHRPVISELLREGQEILVQIAKEPIATKGARITSHIALPGRYIVYMPTVEHIGVSRKIGTDEERQRLKRTLHQLRAEAAIGGGFIVRTAANGCTIDELRDDMQYLARTWSDIRRRAERAKAPAVIHRDLDLVQRILRDQLSSDFSAIRVDNEFEYERVVDFINRFAPRLIHRVKLYTKDTPILEEYGIQSEVDKAVKPRVWLKSGGYIVINQTEALVAIDVNTGKFVGRSNRLEDTIVKTNLEAAKEIVRQVRLRDLGGIIVLDFIDMEERRNRIRVMQALEQELRNDRSPSKILQFNDFGLVAITRKRVKQSLERTLCTPCSYCGGGGMVKSAQTVSYEILAEARRVSKDIDSHTEVILRVNPEVARALRGTERDILGEIEAYLGGVLTIKSDPTVHQEQFDIALV
jgi:ribonuclease G